ncbi:hypothetical protein KC19_VG281600 [Ceratodon purpureus]|uniref:Uncharacterized protein n=1 Tax=Ceratodon purpureus TaxID=3225 RepID=A0A8T0HV51_CERPU|nr:hypothetical protein KC19_VG281600 [Ceratodon purpureus]
MMHSNRKFFTPTSLGGAGCIGSGCRLRFRTKDLPTDCSEVGRVLLVAGYRVNR